MDKWKIFPGLGCTTMSQADPPPMVHLLGANWRSWHVNLKLSLSLKVGCTAPKLSHTQSGTSARLGCVARDRRTFCLLGSKSARTLSCNPALHPDHKLVVTTARVEDRARVYGSIGNFRKDYRTHSEVINKGHCKCSGRTAEFYILISKCIGC